MGRVVMWEMKNGGKGRRVLMVDEFGRMVLEGMERLMGRGGKENVGRMVGVEELKEGVREYGEKSGKMVKGCWGREG